MKRKILNILLTAAIVFSFLPGAAPILAKPASTTPTTQQPETESYYLEFNLPDLPTGYTSERVESWFFERFMDALQQLRPQLLAYIEQGALEDFSVDRQQFRLTLVNPASFVLDELKRFPDLLGIYPLQDGLSVQGEGSAAESHTFRQVEEATRQQDARQAEQDDDPPQEPEAAGGPPAGGESTTGETATAYFVAYLWDRRVYGYTSVVSTAYTVSVTRDSFLLAQATGTSDSVGYYSVYLYDSSGSSIAMQPGDLVTVAESGGYSTSLVLPEITVQANVAQDTVAVTAPANQPLEVWIYTDIWYLVSGTTSTTGAFNVDFTASTNFIYDDYGWVYLNGVMGTQNQVHMSYDVPELHARLESEAVWGHSGLVGAGPHQVLVTEYDPGGAFMRSALVSADNRGYFYVSALSVQPGERFEFTSPQGELVSLTIPVLTLTADPDTDTAYGQAPPFAELELRIYDALTSSSYYAYDVLADAAGFYSHDFTGVVDISAQDTARVWYYLPDGNYVYLYDYVPYITVILPYAEVYGYVAPYEDVIAYLRSASGSIKAIDYAFSYNDGWFYVTFRDYATGDPAEILTGDVIEVISASTSQSIAIPALSTNVDLAADTISGQTDPNMPVEIYVCFYDTGGNYCYSFFTLADSSGYYSISIGGWHDIHAGDEIDVYYTTLQGHRIVDFFYLPNRVSVNHWENYAYVYTTANSPVDVTLQDSGGVVKAVFGGTSSFYGYLYLGTLGDIAPGDLLTVVAGGVTTQVRVVDLAITGYDRVNDVLQGRGPANADLSFYIQGSNDYYGVYVPTDAAGVFSLDLSAQWDLRGGDYVELLYVDADGSPQWFDSFVPMMEVYPLYREVSGYGAPSSTVVVYLKDSAGNLKASAQTTVSWGHWYVYFEVDILPGDILEMHNAGVVTSMVVQEVSLTANALTDVVSGRGPANAWGYLYGSNSFDYYETNLAFGADGTFQLDLSAVFDIQHLTYLYLTWYSAEGDGVVTYYRVPGVGLSEGYDYGYGYSSTPESLINLTLRDAGGVKATAQVTTSANGYFYTNGFCAAGVPVDVEIGDALYSPDADVPVIATTAAINLDSDTISGTTAPNAALIISVESGSGNWYFNSQVLANAAGAFSLDLSGVVDLIPGDYATLIWFDGEGDIVFYTVWSVSSSGAAAITSVPDAARPNAPVYIGWQTSGGLYQSYTYLRWDTVSHACDRNYRYYADAYTSDADQFSGMLTAPAAGTIYVSAMAYIDGYQVWSPEVAIPVAEMAPVITDPVNGTTNDSTPTLQGFGPADAVIQFYAGATLLGSTTINAEGQFTFTLPAPLSNGEHLITAVVPSAGLTSNTVYLTVQAGWLIDPNHIFFTDRGVRFRIRDDQGYANVGGRIWIRPNDTVQIELPVRTCVAPFDVTLTVGAVVYDMFYAGDEIWVGSFLLPSSDYAIIANINCSGTPVNLLLTYGLIDPDGYVYDAEGGSVLQGALVTCYVYSEDSGQYEVWDAATWDQINPQWTDADGYYSFIVPPGEYKVEATYPGFLMNASPPLTVVDEPVHYNIPLFYRILYRLILPLINK